MSIAKSGNLKFMKTRMESEEVLYAEDPIVSVTDEDLEVLKCRANVNSRNRIRLCAHPHVSDKLHEMIIILKRNAYFPPHKHIKRSESLHIIEGIADMVVFNDDGSIFQVLPLGGPGSGRSWYCRLNSSVYHTLLIRSEFLIFHETINGPFQKGNNQLAPWAPDGSDPKSNKRYLEQLDTLAARFMKNATS
ncbi:WbuC family cupin fold metalloprotein [Methanoregula sp.]|uniref:WbuC family cupin fold metalloprotein n=3 Tax=Methanoregula sp. TaxID=2052170 RepID=UPI003BB20DF9